MLVHNEVPRTRNFVTSHSRLSSTGTVLGVTLVSLVLIWGDSPPGVVHCGSDCISSWLHIQSTFIEATSRGHHKHIQPASQQLFLGGRTPNHPSHLACSIATVSVQPKGAPQETHVPHPQGELTAEAFPVPPLQRTQTSMCSRTCRQEELP